MCFGRQFYTPPTKERGTIQNDEKSFSFLLILGKINYWEEGIGREKLQRENKGEKKE